MGRESRPTPAALLPDHRSGTNGARAPAIRLGAFRRGGQPDRGGMKMRNWRAEVRSRLVTLDLPATRIAGIADEVGQHLEDRYGHLVATGVSEDAADRLLLQELSESDVLTREVTELSRG